MISLRAVRPSFSGIVMSSVMTSGLSSWKRAIASVPLPASPTTSWPPLVSASLTIFRMNAASSTTRTRAIGPPPSGIRLMCSEDDRTVSIRTAQSVPSTTIRRPVAKSVPLT